MAKTLRPRECDGDGAGAGDDDGDGDNVILIVWRI